MLIGPLCAADPPTDVRSIVDGYGQLGFKCIMYCGLAGCHCGTCLKFGAKRESVMHPNVTSSVGTAATSMLQSAMSAISIGR